MPAPVIDRDEFREWLTEAAEREDVAGVTGDGYQCPIARFYESKGYRVFAGRLCVFVDGHHNDRVRYPRWAEVFVRVIDVRMEQTEENGWVFIPAQIALEVLKGISV